MDSLETVGSSNLFNSVASLRIAKMNSVKALKGNDFRVSDKRVPTVLSEVQLNSLQEMKGYTFMSCYNLSNVVIPNVTKIGNNNFAYCLNLSSIDMSKCSKIGTGNFLCCGISSLNISSYNGHLASGLLSGASHLREVFVGDMSKK